MSGTAATTDFAARLRAALRDELPAAVALRHTLHAAPHLSGAEDPTTAAVVGALGLGEGVPVSGTGRLVATAPGAVALRAELDALPVVEATGAPWSATGTAMHACGHDVHLAAVVAVTRAVAAADPDRPVAALLQPREEGSPSGAADVVRGGMLDRLDVTAVVAAHVQPQLTPGVVDVTPGLVNASADEFEIVVEGHGGHAGYPHTVRDPVVALSAVVPFAPAVVLAQAVGMAAGFALYRTVVWRDAVVPRRRQVVSFVLVNAATGPLVLAAAVALVRLGAAGGLPGAPVEAAAHAAAIARAVAHGRPLPARAGNPRRAALDAIFLQALDADPAAFPETFRRLVRDVPGPAFARFMADASSLADEARVIAACPKLPFARAALRRAEQGARPLDRSAG